MPDLFNEQFGKRLYEARKKRGMSRAQVGEKVELHESTVKRYEDGLIISVGMDKISAFANALNTSIAYLIGAVDDIDDNSITTLSLEYDFFKHRQKRMEIEIAEGNLLITARKICGVVEGIPDEDLLTSWTPERINNITNFIQRNADMLRASMPKASDTQLTRFMQGHIDAQKINADKKRPPDESEES